jgi:multidrug transporter EmrE-like cation transporter
MWFYVSIGLAVLSAMAYHVIIKYTPSDVNPALSLIVTYTVSIVLCAGLFIVFPLAEPLTKAVRRLNWASYALALALVGLELGFLLAYRAGWRASVASLIVSATGALLLAPVAVNLFKERLSPVNLMGIAICTIGLVMVNLGK